MSMGDVMVAFGSLAALIGLYMFVTHYLYVKRVVKAFKEEVDRVTTLRMDITKQLEELRCEEIEEEFVEINAVTGVNNAKSKEEMN